MESRVGLALKSITWTGPERDAEPYLLIYSGTEAVVRAGKPLLTATRPLEGLRRGTTKTFDGLGLLLVEPVEPGELIAWYVEVWESDQQHRAAGDLLKTASGKVNMNSGLVKALLNAGAQAALSAIQELAGAVGAVLSQAGDDLVFTWAGSLLASELQACTVERGNDKVQLVFEVFVTEAGDSAKVQVGG